MPLDSLSRPPSRAKLAQLEKAIAGERLYFAQKSRRESETEWEAALKAAVKAGVIPDHITNPEPVGTSRVTYADKNTQISLAVVAPIAGYNVPLMLAYLLKCKVDPKLLSRAAGKFKTETKPAHRFTCSRVVN